MAAMTNAKGTARIIITMLRHPSFTASKIYNLISQSQNITKRSTAMCNLKNQSLKCSISMVTLLLLP
jgi:hypothetical protein